MTDFYAKCADFARKQVEWSNHEIKWLTEQMHFEKDYYGYKTDWYKKCENRRNREYRDRKKHEMAVEKYSRMAERSCV